jgi:hypothetical protein
MDTEADSELHTFLSLQARIQLGCNGLENPQADVQSTLGVIFMGL